MIKAALIYAIILINLGKVLDFLPGLAELRLGRVAVSAALIYLLVFDPMAFSRALRGNPFTRYLLAITALAGAGIAFSVWRGGAFEAFTAYLKTLCIFMAVCALAAGGTADTVRRAALAAMGGLGFMLVAARSSGALDDPNGRLHVSGTYDPNDIALFFVTFLPVAVAEALGGGNKIMRLLALAASGAAIIGIALTQSRGGLLSLVVVAAHALLMARGRAWMLLPILAAGAAIFLHYADVQIWQRFEELGEHSDYNFTDRAGRLEIWKEGMLLMASRPLLGVGIGQFANALGMDGSGVYMTAHNSYIQIGAELGVFGLFIYLAMLRKVREIGKSGAALAQSGAIDRLRSRAIILSITGFATGSFLLSLAYSPILYTLLALAALMAMEQKKAIAADAAGEKSASAGSISAKDGETARAGRTPIKHSKAVSRGLAARKEENRLEIGKKERRP